MNSKTSQKYEHIQYKMYFFVLSTNCTFYNSTFCTPNYFVKYKLYYFCTQQMLTCNNLQYKLYFFVLSTNCTFCNTTFCTLNFFVKYKLYYFCTQQMLRCNNIQYKLYFFVLSTNCTIYYSTFCTVNFWCSTICTISARKHITTDVCMHQQLVQIVLFCTKYKLYYFLGVQFVLFPHEKISQQTAT